MERKLATIQKITNIRPIEGADKIEQVSVRGWNVVVKKGEFNENALCVYMEIDSLLPERPEFEFLRPRKFRIRTMKLKGSISQGIAFPFTILPEEYQLQKLAGDVSIGEDVTEILGITKYEEPIPACLGGTAKGRFPSHSIKTDEERIQNLTELFPEYKKYTWVATEKLDGCLDENTILETEEGEKTIREICDSKYQGKVKSLNLDKQKEEFRKILSHSIKDDPDRQWFEIILENNKKIKITGNHEVWIPKLKCWRRVDELDGNEEFLLKK